MARFTIIAFGYEIADVRKHEQFIARTNAATAEAFLLLIKNPAKMSQAPVIDIRRMLMPESGPPPQYDDCSSVYFLNDAALMMCRELELSLQVIGESETPPMEANYQLQAQYLPLAER